MELILKHLNGTEQYIFLESLLSKIYKNSTEGVTRKNKVIQKIMDEVNEK